MKGERREAFLTIGMLVCALVCPIISLVSVAAGILIIVSTFLSLFLVCIIQCQDSDIQRFEEQTTITIAIFSTNFTVVLCVLAIVSSVNT